MNDFTTEESLNRLVELLVDRIAAKVAERVFEQSQRRFCSREVYAIAHGLGMRTVDCAISEGRLQTERIGRRVLIPTNATITGR